MRPSVLIALLLLPTLAGSARAEIALLENGQTLKLERHRTEEGQLVLVLKGGGEMGVPPSTVRGFVPDEVMEEIASPPPGADIRALATAAARRHGVDPAIVLAVVSVESAFQPHAVSPKGALGLMQLMPRTAGGLGVADALDPEQNLDGGARHLRSLLALYSGDLTRALAAYNAGAGAVARYGGVPPYRETRSYVRKVLDRYHAAAGAARKPGPARKAAPVRRPGPARKAAPPAAEPQDAAKSAEGTRSSRQPGR